VTHVATSGVTGQDGDVTFSYVSGNPALDLAGTVGSRREAPTELLTTPMDLEQWVAGCEELPDHLTADADGLESTRSLREAVYQLALDRVHGRAFDRASLDLVNQVAAGPPLTIELRDAGVRRSGDLRALLSELARSAIAALADPATTLKECGRAHCTRIYIDRSRGARRTWCGMEACGNRVKAAAYRARQRASAPEL
jgi:predicted RNA-binding Zn ribbon-like protein